MPIQYKNLFFTENAVAHVCLRKDNLYEIRCQVDGKKITATSKLLATAKKKFIGKLHEYIGKPKEAPKEESPQKAVVPTSEFGTYADEWLETVRKPRVKTPTYNDYRNLFDIHLLPTFGKRPLNEIKRSEIQEYLNGFISAGKNRAAQKQKQLLTSIFEYAVEDGLVERSPMTRITLPYYESENGTALTMEEELSFVERCIQSETLSGKAFLFILYCGLRRSELASAEIDGEWITVLSAKQRKGRKEKTRRIPISPRLRKVLPNLEDDLQTFKGLYLNRLGRTFKEWLPNHHLHELRHTFITRAQECGIKRELVSLWAGHAADSSIKSNVYTHLEQNEAHQIAEMSLFSYVLT